MAWKSIAVAALWGVLAAPASAAGDLAEVSVHERTGGRALTVYRHEGRRYVVGRPGNEYRIRVRNRSGSDILAVVSVDGINAVSGETANWAQTGYVLSAGHSFDIAGWRKSLDRVASFYFTEHANSYAARTGRPGNVGVIGVAVFRRKAVPAAILPPLLPDDAQHDRAEAPPAGPGAEAPESSPAAGSGMARQSPAPGERRARSLGTGHGRSTTSRVTHTHFERASAHPEEVIAIHYDTYENLAALGVIRAPRYAAPSPFPGHFVPDPY